jgi:chromosome segregation ATPase
MTPEREKQIREVVAMGYWSGSDEVPQLLTALDEARAEVEQKTRCAQAIADDYERLTDERDHARAEMVRLRGEQAILLDELDETRRSNVRLGVECDRAREEVERLRMKLDTVMALQGIKYRQDLIAERDQARRDAVELWDRCLTMNGTPTQEFADRIAAYREAITAESTPEAPGS